MTQTSFEVVYGAAEAFSALNSIELTEEEEYEMVLLVEFALPVIGPGPGRKAEKRLGIAAVKHVVASRNL